MRAVPAVLLLLQELVDLIDRCQAANPRERPTAKEVYEALLAVPGAPPEGALL